MSKKVQNRERLLKRLEEIPKEVRAAIRPAIEQGAREIADMARNLAPRDSGDLQNSIGYTFGDYKPENSNVRGVSVGQAGDKDLTAIIHAGDARAFYARWVEFGVANSWEIGGRFEGATHPGFSAQPFFFPSYRANKRKVKNRISRATTKAVKAAAKKT